MFALLHGKGSYRAKPESRTGTRDDKMTAQAHCEQKPRNASSSLWSSGSTTDSIVDGAVSFIPSPKAEQQENLLLAVEKDNEKEFAAPKSRSSRFSKPSLGP